MDSGCGERSVAAPALDVPANLATSCAGIRHQLPDVCDSRTWPRSYESVGAAWLRCLGQSFGLAVSLEERPDAFVGRWRRSITRVHAGSLRGDVARPPIYQPFP